MQSLINSPHKNMSVLVCFIGLDTCSSACFVLAKIHLNLVEDHQGETVHYLKLQKKLIKLA